jgi:hypothetical protein
LAQHLLRQTAAHRRPIGTGCPDAGIHGQCVPVSPRGGSGTDPSLNPSGDRNRHICTGFQCGSACGHGDRRAGSSKRISEGWRTRYPPSL